MRKVEMGKFRYLTQLIALSSSMLRFGLQGVDSFLQTNKKLNEIVILEGDVLSFDGKKMCAGLADWLKHEESLQVLRKRLETDLAEFRTSIQRALLEKVKEHAESLKDVAKGKPRWSVVARGCGPKGRLAHADESGTLNVAQD